MSVEIPNLSIFYEIKIYSNCQIHFLWSNEFSKDANEFLFDNFSFLYHQENAYMIVFGAEDNIWWRFLSLVLEEPIWAPLFFPTLCAESFVEALSRNSESFHHIPDSRELLCVSMHCAPWRHDIIDQTESLLRNWIIANKKVCQFNVPSIAVHESFL